MARSETILEGDDVPTWARFAVMICHPHTRSDRPERDPVQVFSTRIACERWAREVSRTFPARTGDDLTLWALVYALGPDRNTRRARGFTFASGSICYGSYDPGSVRLKWHDIPDGYGVPGRVDREQACACCPSGGW